MKTLFNLIFFISGMLLLHSCTRSEDDIAAKCGEQKTFIDELTAEEKAKVPYTGFDTLTFVRTTVGDTHTFIGTGKNAGYATASVYSGDPDCPDNMANLEYLSYKFVSKTIAEPIYFSIYIKRHNERPYIESSFRGTKFFQGLIVIGRPYNYELLTIQGTTYYSLDRISEPTNPSTDEFYMIYNTDYGFLKLKLQTGEIWELLNKK